MTLDNDPFSDNNPENEQEKDNHPNSISSLEEIKDILEKDKEVASEFNSVIGHHAVETKIGNNRVYSCVKENDNELDGFDLRFPSENKRFTDLESAAKQHLKHCAKVKNYIVQEEAKRKKIKRLKQVAFSSIGIMLAGGVLFYSFTNFLHWIFEPPIGPVLPPDHYENMVKIDNFWIDKTEVSIEDYKKFVTDYERPARFSSDELPVVNISWDDAKKFAEHQGKRLCSDSEWLKALGHTTQTLEDNAHLEGDLTSIPRKVSDTTEVNDWGILNMLGNVREWVNDSKSIGGYWYYKNSNLLNGAGIKDALKTQSSQFHYIGFRCCKD